MAKSLTDDQIIDLLQSDIDASKAYQQQLSTERVRLYKVYRAEKYGNEVPKWSQTVHPTVMTAVEWLKPGLFEVFTGDFFQFKPVKKQEPPIPPMAMLPGPVGPVVSPGPQPMQGQAGPGMPPMGMPRKQAEDPQVESAKRLKQYVRKKLFDQLDGEQIVEDFIHDCLTTHYGILKVCHRDDYDVETEKVDRISQEELAMLLASDDKITDVKGGDDVIETDPVTGAVVNAWIEGATIVRKKQIYNGFHVEVIPALELYFLPGYVTLEKNPFVAHVVKRDLDYVKRQELAGVYKKGTYEAVKTRIDERREQPESAGEYQTLFSVDGLETPDNIAKGGYTEKQKLSVNEVLIWECYCKLDMKGDGLLVPHIVTICEDVVCREPIENPYGGPPFELGYILKEPHKIIGRPMAALLEDRQKVLSNLLRNIQDSAARSAYGGWLTSDHQAKMLLQRMGPGDVCWAPNINNVKEITPSAPSQFIFNAFEMTKSEVSAESGVNENMQGLDDNTLNKTAAGMNMRLTAGMQRQKLYARRIARTFKRVLRRVLDIMRMWPPEDDVAMVGADVMIRPEDLEGQYSIDIEVGVGPQDRMAQAQALDQLVVFATQVGLQAGLIDKPKLTELLKAKYEYLDMDVAPYLNSEEEIAANDQQAQAMQQMQGQLQQMQGQMQQLGQQAQKAMQDAQRLAQENQQLKSQPPEDKSLEVARLQLDAKEAQDKANLEAAKLEIERMKLDLERVKLQLEERKLVTDAQVRMQEAMRPEIEMGEAMVRG